MSLQIRVSIFYVLPLKTASHSIYRNNIFLTIYTASEMTYTVSSGALNSAPTNQLDNLLYTFISTFIGTACIVRGAGSMKRYGVRPFVRPSVRPPACLSQHGPTAANPLL